MEENTTDSILKALEIMARKKEPIDPETYLRASEKLNSLLQDEQAQQYLLEQNVAKMRQKLLEQDKKIGAVKMIVEATDEYREMRNQKAKVERIIEQIRLGKTHANLSKEVYRSN